MFYEHAPSIPNMLLLCLVPCKCPETQCCPALVWRRLYVYISLHLPSDANRSSVWRGQDVSFCVLHSLCYWLGYLSRHENNKSLLCSFALSTSGIFLALWPSCSTSWSISVNFLSGISSLFFFVFHWRSASFVHVLLFILNRFLVAGLIIKNIIECISKDVISHVFSDRGDVFDFSLLTITGLCLDVATTDLICVFDANNEGVREVCVPIGLCQGMKIVNYNVLWNDSSLRLGRYVCLGRLCHSLSERITVPLTRNSIPPFLAANVTNIIHGNYLFFCSGWPGLYHTSYLMGKCRCIASKYIASEYNVMEDSYRLT